LDAQIPDWLAEVLPAGTRVGIDPFCHTVDAVRSLRTKLQVRAGVRGVCMCARCMRARARAWVCGRTRVRARVLMSVNKQAPK
jgi:hypothetical protein